MRLPWGRGLYLSIVSVFYLILWACLTGRFPVLGVYAEGSTLALYSAARADRGQIKREAGAKPALSP